MKMHWIKIRRVNSVSLLRFLLGQPCTMGTGDHICKHVFYCHHYSVVSAGNPRNGSTTVIGRSENLVCWKHRISTEKRSKEK